MQQCWGFVPSINHFHSYLCCVLRVEQYPELTGWSCLWILELFLLGNNMLSRENLNTLGTTSPVPNPKWDALVWNPGWMSTGICKDAHLCVWGILSKDPSHKYKILFAPRFMVLRGKEVERGVLFSLLWWFLWEILSYLDDLKIYIL